MGIEEAGGRTARRIRRTTSKGAVELENLERARAVEHLDRITRRHIDIIGHDPRGGRGDGLQLLQICTCSTESVAAIDEHQIAREAACTRCLRERRQCFV